MSSLLIGIEDNSWNISIHILNPQCQIHWFVFSWDDSQMLSCQSKEVYRMESRESSCVGLGYHVPISYMFILPEADEFFLNTIDTQGKSLLFKEYVSDLSLCCKRIE